MFERVKKTQKAHSYGIACELCGDPLALECAVTESEASSKAWAAAHKKGLYARHTIYPELLVFACMRCVRAVVWAYFEREAKEAP